MNYEFNEISLLKEALTHSSLKNDFNISNIKDNEKLEFIGDAVLDLIVSNFLLSKAEYSTSEGSLTINRAKLVNEKSLYIFANHISLSKYLLISSSAKKMLVQNNIGVLADTFEALVGAIFFDSNYNTVEEIIINTYKDTMVSILEDNQNNYKGYINELVYKYQLTNPTYEVIDIKGPDHNRIYKSKLTINNLVFSIGQGNTIKESEQSAAKEVILLLKEKGYV